MLGIPSFVKVPVIAVAEAFFQVAFPCSSEVKTFPTPCAPSIICRAAFGAVAVPVVLWKMLPPVAVPVNGQGFILLGYGSICC